MNQRSPIAPQLAVLLSAVLWGTLWIPVRRLHELGSDGPVWTTLGFLLPLGLLLPPAIRRRRQTLAALRDFGMAGFWLALGIALYAEGITRGEVGRVVLLFYLTPVWSTLLARVVLGDAISARGVATMALGLAGMFVIFGAGGEAPLPRTSADWMGLVAGLAWAIALVSSRRERPPPLFDRLFVHFVFLGPVFFAVTQLPGGESATGLELTSNAELLGWVMAFALAWMLPVMWLTLIGASHVPPGRFAILLMFEVVVALATSGLLTEERLAPREYFGALLILAGIASEIVIRPSRSRDAG